jgi:succinate dehydrogenase / fumarate reductase, flavoprotein subunit
VEHQTPDGEAQRDDENFCFVSVWERPTEPGPYIRHHEPLTFTAVPLETRNYKTR